MPWGQAFPFLAVPVDAEKRKLTDMTRLNQAFKPTVLACLGGLLISAGELTSQATDLPFHELDPYLVEAGSGDEALQRMELLEENRLLFDGVSGARTGSWLSSAELLASGAGRIEDLFWQMPGAVRQARFGVTTVPTVRGDAAETLFNGQRRGDNLFGIPLTLTAVESIEMVAGPVPLSAGIGKRTGGMVNLTTRRPVIGKAFGMTEIRLGSFVPDGDSYGTAEVTLDLNIGMGKRDALRLSAGFREDETFYRRNGGRDDYRELYAAWRREGAESILDWIFSYQEYDRPQTLGVNRPWQGLIDNNRYFTGTVDPEVGQGDPPGPLDPGVADPGLLTGGPEDVVKIDPDRVLMSKGDVGKGEAYLSQVIWRKPLAGDLQFTQMVLGERVFREKLNQFLYAEDVEQLTLDSISRLEGLHENRLGRLDWEGGLQVRLEERENRTNYWNEFAYAYDLTQGRRFNTYERFPGYIAPGAVAGPDGREWYLPSSFFSTPETTDSELRQMGLYGQARQELGNNWALSGQVRVDWFDVEAEEPRSLAGADALQDEAKPRLVSGSVSLHKDWERGAAYATAGAFRSIAGNTVGDGINLYAPGELLRDDFLNRSRLYEIGGLWRPVDDLAVSGALFHQERTRQEFFGSNDIRARGFDLRLDWQARQSTRIELSAHFLDARYDNASPAEFGGGSLWNVYAMGEGPTQEGNGFGYIGGFFLNSLPPGDYRLPGLSRWTLGLGIEEAIGEHLTFRLWGGWQSRQAGNLAGEYEIPEQMEWNASLRYSAGRWDCLLIARNLLDAENWIHNGDTFFDQMLVSRNLPLRLEGRLRIRF